MLNIDLDIDGDYAQQKEIENRYEERKNIDKRSISVMRDYLTKKRMFTDDTINAFELGVYHDKKLTIPLLDQNGRTVALAWRSFEESGPKYVNSKNNLLYDKSCFLFNLDKARRLIRDKVYIVEGYMDAMSGHQMGLPTVAYCGSEIHKDQIVSLSQYLQKDTSIIICPDNDDAGMDRTPLVSEIISKRYVPERQVRVICVPDGIKDMNDMLVAGINPADLPSEDISKFVLRRILNKCKTIEQEYSKAEEFFRTVSSQLIKLDIIHMLSERWGKEFDDLKKTFSAVGEDTESILQEASNVDDCIADLRQIYESGGYPTHFQQIDNCIHKVEKKQVVIVGACAGCGKSNFAIEYMLRAICHNKQRVIFFSLEMPKGKLMERIIAQLLKVPVPDVENLILQGNPLVLKILDLLRKKLIVFDGNSMDMEGIARRIDIVNAKELLGGPVDMVFVDYFGYVKGTSDFEGASNAAREMKGIAKSRNIIFVMLSQLNRSGNEYSEPTMQQLKLTGDLEASGDIVMLLWRPEKDPNLALADRQELENVTRLKICKARDGMYGSNMIQFKYNKQESRLEECYM
jgi:DNA primase